MSAAVGSLARWISQNVARRAMLPKIGRTSPTRDLTSQWMAGGPGEYLYGGGDNLYRGLRNQSQADVLPNGSLVLYPGRNFDNRVEGISFSRDPSIALEYATRTGGPIWGDTRQSAGAVVRFPFEKVRANPRLVEETLGETAIYQDFPLTIPRGSWEVGYLDKPFSGSLKQLSVLAKKFESMPIDEVLERQALRLLERVSPESAEFAGDIRRIVNPSDNTGTARWITGSSSADRLESSLEIQRLRQEAKKYNSPEEMMSRFRNELNDRNDYIGMVIEEAGEEFPFWSLLSKELGLIRPIDPPSIPY